MGYCCGSCPGARRLKTGPPLECASGKTRNTRTSSSAHQWVARSHASFNILPPRSPQPIVYTQARTPDSMSPLQSAEQHRARQRNWKDNNRRGAQVRRRCQRGLCAISAMSAKYFEQCAQKSSGSTGPRALKHVLIWCGGMTEKSRGARVGRVVLFGLGLDGQSVWTE